MLPCSELDDGVEARAVSIIGERTERAVAQRIGESVDRCFLQFLPSYGQFAWILGERNIRLLERSITPNDLLSFHFYLLSP